MYVTTFAKCILIFFSIIIMIIIKGFATLPDIPILYCFMFLDELVSAFSAT